MSDLLHQLIEETNNEYTAIADDGIEAGDVTGYIGTGSYVLNALLSGSIYKGLAQNKVTAFAGSPSVGKTFYTLNVVRQFLQDHPDGFVFYFESESAISRQFLIDRNIDAKRVVIVPVTTVQEFRTQAVKILDKYMEQKIKPPMLMALDSLGNLSTDKEIADITSGKDVRDMTRSQLIRGAFRVLTLKLGKAKVPLIVTNHIYDVIGSYVPTKKMGGGCLVGGTKILTPLGKQNIEDLGIGDKVTTLFGEDVVTNKFVFENKRLYKITFNDGSVVNCSEDHKFLVNGEWKTVNALLELDKNTTNLNIEVASIEGDIDVFRQQIQENLFSVGDESKE